MSITLYEERGIRRVLSFIGIDKTVALQLAQRFWNAIALPITLLILTARLSLSEQGFYYSFYSVQALSVIFELGMTFVITQYAAHENARITDSERESKDARSRLGSLLRLGVKWNAVGAMLYIVVLIPLGRSFFQSTKGGASEAWLLPWILLGLVGAASLLTAPLNAVLEGVGFIRDTSLIRFIQSLVSTCVLWAGFMADWGLYSVAASQFAALLISGIGLGLLHSRTLMKIWFDKSDASVNYIAEIWPMHWRVALSWLAGYVGFYLSTPVIFKALSPEEAGRYGLTAGLLLSATGVASIWVNSRSPSLAKQASLGDKHGMQREFEGAAIRSCIALGLLFLGLVTVVWLHPYLPVKIRMFERLLSGLNLYTLMASMFLLHVYGILNVYFRAFRSDPLFYVSTGAAILCVVGLLVAAKSQDSLLIISVPLLINFATCALGMHRYFIDKIK